LSTIARFSRSVGEESLMAQLMLNPIKTMVVKTTKKVDFFMFNVYRSWFEFDYSSLMFRFGGREVWSETPGLSLWFDIPL
jgi:hypothetical protein